MLMLLHVKHHKDHTMTVDCFASNKNVEATLINMRYIKEVSVFDESEILNLKPYNDYLIGSNSCLWINQTDKYHVVETVFEIKQLLGINDD